MPNREPVIFSPSFDAPQASPYGPHAAVRPEMLPRQPTQLERPRAQATGGYTPDYMTRVLGYVPLAYGQHLLLLIDWTFTESNISRSLSERNSRTSCGSLRA